MVRTKLEVNLPSVELLMATTYRVEDRQQRPMYPGGRIVWFYRLTGHKRCNVYHDFLQRVNG